MTTPDLPHGIPTDPNDTLLSAGTAMDAVTLHAADLDGLADYYRDALGLEDVDVNAEVLSEDPCRRRVVLGHAGTPLIVLVDTPDLPAPGPGQAGLFHTALLYADRASLAAALARAAGHPRSRYAGAADHLVSLAFYFTDPEGDGIELYWDRPREQWTWDRGRVAMASLPLDPNDFLREHLGDQSPLGPKVGHVHLKVGDVAKAEEFYVDTLGFQITTTFAGALFVSAGGYHHHMAMNTWKSRGAGPRAATIGLGLVRIAVPDRQHLDALAGRLTAHRITADDDGRALRFRDPWDSRIEVAASG